MLPDNEFSNEKLLQSYEELHREITEELSRLEYMLAKSNKSFFLRSFFICFFLVVVIATEYFMGLHLSWVSFVIIIIWLTVSLYCLYRYYSIKL